MAVIYWVADSTVQYNDITTYPQTGIGQTFPLYLKAPHSVSNHAKNGRSTKSFLEEGRFLPVEEAMKKGDFLFIQFGHNDEKAQDPSRYTLPQGSFKENLTYMILSAREKGAYPVLITPVERRHFVEEGSHTLKESAHTDYVNAMRELGAELQVPVVDLFAMSRQLLEEAGEEESRQWFMHIPEKVYAFYPEGKADDTHLQYKGAVNFAGLIAKGLGQIGGIYADLLIDN